MAGCTDVTASFKTIDKPDVKYKVVTGGVLLKWEPVIDADGYEVWRVEKNKPEELIKSFNQTAYEDKDAGPLGGQFVYADIVSKSNVLKADTDYKYIVIATSTIPGKDPGKWEKTIKYKAEELPAETTQAAAPKNVKLEINYGEQFIKVTITPPDSGNIPIGYWVGIVKDNNWSPNAYIDTFVYADPLAKDPAADIIYITRGSNARYLDTVGGEFVAQATGQLSGYFQPSAGLSAPIVKVDTLYNGNGYISSIVRSLVEPGTASSYGELKNYAIGINLDFQTKNGVKYTLQRADQDEGGATGDFKDVAKVYRRVRNDAGDYVYEEIKWNEIDPVDNVQALTIYETGLTPVKKGYAYRIKAEKDTYSDYIGSRTNYKVLYVGTEDPLDNLNIKLSLGAKSASGSYSVTPSIDYKNVLKDEKVIVYYLRSNDPGYGYTESVTLSKADLEKREASNGVPVKLGNIPDQGTTVGTTRNLYLQARLVDKDGKFISTVPINGTYVYDAGIDNAGYAVYRVTDY